MATGFHGTHGASCRSETSFLSKHSTLCRATSHRGRKLVNARMLADNGCSQALSEPSNSQYDLRDTERSIEVGNLQIYPSTKQVLTPLRDPQARSAVGLTRETILRKTFKVGEAGDPRGSAALTRHEGVSRIEAFYSMPRNAASYWTEFIQEDQVINAKSSSQLFPWKPRKSAYRRSFSTEIETSATVLGDHPKGEAPKALAENGGATDRKEKIIPQQLDPKNIFDVITSTANLRAAWYEMKSHTGNATPGANVETGITDSWFTRTSSQLKTGKYKYLPSRRVPKKIGGVRPLTVVDPRDQIVQRAFLRILEPFFEGEFSVKDITEKRYNQMKLQSMTSPTRRAKYLERAEVARSLTPGDPIKGGLSPPMTRTDVFRRGDAKSYTFYEKVWTRPKIFAPNSYGFRTGCGVHSALQQIKSWPGTLNWWLDYDVVPSGPLNSVKVELRHHRMINILRKHVPNQQLLDEVLKMLGHSTLRLGGLSISNEIGTLSRFLFNVYMNEFDKFVLKLQKGVSTHEICRAKGHTDHARIEDRFSGKRFAALITRVGIQKALNMKKEAYAASRKTGQPASGSRRIFYIRYADAILVGIQGPRSFAIEIQKALNRFLKSDLHLNIKDEAPKSAPSGVKIPFLGFCINAQARSKLVSVRAKEIESATRKRRKILARLRSFNVAHAGIVERLARKNFLAKVNQVGHRLKVRSTNKLATLQHLSKVAALETIRAKLVASSSELIASIDQELQNYKAEPRPTVDRSSSDLDGPSSDPLVATQARQEAYTYDRWFQNLSTSLEDSWSDLGRQSLSKHMNQVKQLLKDACAAAADTAAAEAQAVKGLKKSRSQLPDSEAPAVLLAKDTCTPFIRIRADIKQLRDRLREMLILEPRNSNPRFVPGLINEDDSTIIKWYTHKARGYLNWFRCADNFEEVKTLVNYHLRYSLLRTLATKRNMTQGKAIRICGLTPKVITKDRDDKPRVVAQFLEPHAIRSMSKKFLVG